MFSKETYMGRRAKLKQTIGSGLLLSSETMSRE